MLPPLPPQQARLGYCLSGRFLDLIAGQPDTDAQYRRAALANFVRGKGITCDRPPTNYTLQGRTTDKDAVGIGTYPLYAPPS